jgi:uncharacterized protein (TIGR03067 family)
MEASPDELSPPGAITTFKGDRFSVRDPEGVLLLEGTFTLNDGTTPKAINYVDSIGPDKGKLLLAIYKLESDSFSFVAASEGDPRPTEFRTVYGQTMRTFIRLPRST